MLRRWLGTFIIENMTGFLGIWPFHGLQMEGDPNYLRYLGAHPPSREPTFPPFQPIVLFPYGGSRIGFGRPGGAHGAACFHDAPSGFA